MRVLVALALTGCGEPSYPGPKQIGSHGDYDRVVAGDSTPCIMTTYFRDSDRDSWGDPLQTRNACVQPPGYVLNNLDCWDGDARAKPGQTEFFDIEVAGGAPIPWDFNCNSEEELRYTESAICTNRSYALCGQFFTNAPWEGAPPGCGVSGLAVSECRWLGSSAIGRCVPIVTNRVQACR